MSSVFSTTEQLAAELVDAANLAAIEIVKRAEWQRLGKIATVTGDGVSIGHNLPADYDRMPKEARLYQSSTLTPMSPARDRDQWTQFLVDQVYTAPGHWILLGGKLQILPVLGNGLTVRFPYQSRMCIADGTKSAFSADADVFDLSERVLIEGIVWKWRSNKGLDQPEDLPNFENALAEEIGRDKGARILKVTGRRGRIDANLAYPGTIVP